MNNTFPKPVRKNECLKMAFRNGQQHFHQRFKTHCRLRSSQINVDENVHSLARMSLWWRRVEESVPPLLRPGMAKLGLAPARFVEKAQIDRLQSERKCCALPVRLNLSRVTWARDGDSTSTKTVEQNIINTPPTTRFVYESPRWRNNMSALLLTEATRID